MIQSAMQNNEGMEAWTRFRITLDVAWNRL